MARKLIVEIIGDSSSLEKSFKRTSVGANKFEKDLGRTVRGSAAASGAFKSLGRSLAFASGGFLAGASITGFLRSSITQAEQAAVAQKQLAAQFKAAGQSLGTYQGQIDKTVSRLSNLAGIEDDEVKASFTLAFRATQNVTQGLRLVGIAADVARARNISLAQATLALNKAYGGNVGALRRLGITIPKTLTGMKALDFVARRFAGQARAGTTDQERFNAAFVNFQQIVGTELLPTFNKYLRQLTHWLRDSKHQKEISHDVSKAVHILGDAWAFAARGVQKYNDATNKINSLPGPLKEVLKVLFVPGFGLNRVLQGIGKPSSVGGSGLPPGVLGPSGPKGTAPTAPTGLAGVLLPSPTLSQRTGLRAQFQRSQLALAIAQTTATQADDRRVLEQQRKIILAAIRLTTNLKKRRTLYGQLANIQDQIAGIDQKAQDARDAHAQKLKDARQKALDAAKARAEKEKAQDAKELALLKSREDRLKTQIKAIQGRFQDQLDAARQGIGDLFAGPVKPDAEQAARKTLRLSGGLALTAGKVIGDVLAQTAQSAKFQSEINRIVKGSGLGKAGRQELRNELTAAGVGSQAQLEAILSGGPGAIKRFGQAFAARERQAAKIATVNMKSQLVKLDADKIQLTNLKQEIHVHSHTHLDGQKIASNTTKYQVRAQRRTAAQRTGRIAGLGPVVG